VVLFNGGTKFAEGTRFVFARNTVRIQAALTSAASGIRYDGVTVANGTEHCISGNTFIGDGPNCDGVSLAGVTCSSKWSLRVVRNAFRFVAKTMYVLGSVNVTLLFAHNAATAVYVEVTGASAGVAVANNTIDGAFALQSPPPVFVAHNEFSGGRSQSVTLSAGAVGTATVAVCNVGFRPTSAVSWTVELPCLDAANTTSAVSPCLGPAPPSVIPLATAVVSCPSSPRPLASCAPGRVPPVFTAAPSEGDRSHRCYIQRVAVVATEESRPAF
jgi:hypothetical protein